MSIGVKEIAFVGYPVTDFAKSRDFYGGLLGLRESLVMEGDSGVHWVEYDISGATLALAPAGEHWKPDPNGGGVSLEVGDLDSAISTLKENGVEMLLNDIGDFPMCRIAVIKDPDGNGIALHQRKPNHPDHQS